ncbi:MAG: hypothetical protein RTU92_07175 [Candidatus Thorarchaeota archaeon]
MSSKSPDIRTEDVYRLYFEEGMTQRQIAQKLGLSSHARINRIFKVNGWEARSAAPPREEADSEEVYRLYFDEQKSMKEVAEILGLKGISPIQRIFKENRWNVRGRWGQGCPRRSFSNDDERKQAKQERYELRKQRLKKLREDLFGNKCRICGVGRDEKMLAIHRKDFQGHEQNLLWKAEILRTLNPNEYAALCVACHRGVHWMHTEHSISWAEIEQILAQRTGKKIQSKEPFILPNQQSIIRLSDCKSKQKIEDLRKLLFDTNCQICGEDYKKRRLVIHRKDGRPHWNGLLRNECSLRSLNQDEWTALCQKCHRYVHWAMDNLQMIWDDFARPHV